MLVRGIIAAETQKRKDTDICVRFLISIQSFSWTNPSEEVCVKILQFKFTFCTHMYSHLQSPDKSG